jgi:small-conductance mechanosensitive channel
LEDYKLQIVETIIAVLGFVVTQNLVNRITDKVGLKFSYHKTRIKIVKKVISTVFYLILAGFLLFIWGVDRSELVFFISSLLTVLGIAFFAQWSIISNITSTLIIFFYHQVNIGDQIVILDKEFQIEGKISDIGVFFIVIKVAEEEYVSLPSNVFIQKMIKKVKQ